MRKPSSSDLPLLRVLRDAYRKMLEAARECRSEEKDPGMHLAWATVTDEIQTKFEAVGIRLSQLEKAH